MNEEQLTLRCTVVTAQCLNPLMTIEGKLTLMSNEIVGLSNMLLLLSKISYIKQLVISKTLI